MRIERAPAIYPHTRRVGDYASKTEAR